MKALRSVSSFSAYGRADSHLVQKTTTGAVSKRLRHLSRKQHCHSCSPVPRRIG